MNLIKKYELIQYIYLIDDSELKQFYLKKSYNSMIT